MQLVGKKIKLVVLASTAVLLFAGIAHASSTPQRFAAGQKAKVKGMIVSRNGDLITVKEKSGTVSVVDLNNDTKIERDKAFRLRGKEMDVTAMVPGLTIDAEGVGNTKGQLDAKKITFNPDTFAIEVAEEQQIQANKAAAGAAQSRANQGVAAASAAQSSANKAQSSANMAQSSANTAQTTANEAGQAAVAAGGLAVADASAVQLVNARVSDLGDYNTVEEAALFFDPNSSTLSDSDKQALNKLAGDAMSTENYMIEIAGYASSTGTKAENQKLSDARATVVAEYLRDSKSVPMRRILAPAGYGASHPAAPNSDPEGRDINRRVDVKVIVNKGLNEAL
jgi:outer membrane protein OmpA-like peptidoglycan-associated protein